MGASTVPAPAGGAGCCQEFVCDFREAILMRNGLLRSHLQRFQAVFLPTNSLEQESTLQDSAAAGVFLNGN
jgi:hypothetical protein